MPRPTCLGPLSPLAEGTSAGLRNRQPRCRYLRRTSGGSSSVGRAAAFQAACREFEPRLPLHLHADSPHLGYRRRVTDPRDPAAPALTRAGWSAAGTGWPRSSGSAGWPPSIARSTRRFDRAVAVKLLRREVDRRHRHRDALPARGAGRDGAAPPEHRRPASRPAPTTASRSWSWSSSRARTWRPGCGGSVGSPRRGGPDRPRRRPRAGRGAHPRASSIATSSPATSCSPATAGRWSPTSGSPGWRPTPRARSRHDPRLGPLLQPRAGQGRDDDRRIRRLQPRAGAVRGADRAAGMERRDDSGPGGASGSVPMPRRRARPPGDARPRWTRSSSGRSTRIRRVASPAGRWPPRSSRSCSRPDPASPTVGVPTRPPWPRRAAAAAAAASPTGQRRRCRGSVAAPSTLAPSALSRRPGLGTVRRASPVIAGAARRARRSSSVVVVGGLLRRSRCPAADSGGGRARQPDAARNRPARPTPDRPADRRPDRRRRTKRQPTPIPRSRPRSRQRARRATCATRSSVSRAAWRRGPTSPPRFEPPILFKLRDGWSTSVWESDLIGLDRQRGRPDLRQRPDQRLPERRRDRCATLRSPARRDVHRHRRGRRRQARRPARSTSTRRRSSTWRRPARIGLPLFGTSTQTFYLEPFGTTRLDRHRRRRWGPRDRHRAGGRLHARALLPEANRVVASVRFR